MVWGDAAVFEKLLYICTMSCSNDCTPSQVHSFDVMVLVRFSFSLLKQIVNDLLIKVMQLLVAGGLPHREKVQPNAHGN